MLPAVEVVLSREPGFSESYEPTRFEQLAVECGFTEPQLRLVLRKEIAKRLGWGTPRRVIVCSSCGTEFELSDRRARELLARGEPRCLLCRHETTDAPDMTWMATLPTDVLEKAVAALATLAA